MLKQIVQKYIAKKRDVAVQTKKKNLNEKRKNWKFFCLLFFDTLNLGIVLMLSCLDDV